MFKNNIDSMTNGAWLDYWDKLLYDFYAAGHELTADPECNTCGLEDGYVCFQCECVQIDKWRNNGL